MSQHANDYRYHKRLTVTDVNNILNDRRLNRYQRFSILAGWKTRLDADRMVEKDPQRRSLKREIERSLILFH